MTATKLTVSRSQLLALKPCNPSSRIALFGSAATLTCASALAAGASISDVLWVAARLGRKGLCIQFALACAVRAEKFDKSGKAAACNKASSAYLISPTPENLAALRTARTAAHAAYAAAHAAHARDKEIEAQKKALIEIFGA